MHEDYHEYLTRIVVKARSGHSLKTHHNEEDLAFMLNDSLFHYGLTPIKDIESRSGEKIDYDVLLMHLAGSLKTNVKRFFNI